MKTNCIITTLAKNKDGYGKTTHKGKDVLAHRLAWIKAFGEIPSGMFVCHHCDNPACVNIDHLFLGTPADNMKDRDKKGRNARGENIGISKLSPATVQKIRMLVSGGASQSKVAKEFGVCQATISNIARRFTWRHI